MLRIAICEDEKEFADSLEKSLKNWEMKRGLNVSIRKFDHGTPLLYCINDNGMFDLIFMDVVMDKMNGLETAAKIRETDHITSIIFLSQYDEYFKQAYEVHPFHFLSKPVAQEELERVMDSFMEMKKQDVETFAFCINKSQYVIPLSEVLYFNSERRHINIICKDRTYVFYGKLGEVQAEIEKKNCKFIRIHQSFLVNAKHIRTYHYETVVMENGETLAISRDKRKRMVDVHKMFLEE